MTSLNTVWLLICGTLVFFMQAGFAMLETGFTRAKNAGNIVMKNIIDICIGAPVFFFIGFGLMFGKNCGFIGNLDLFIRDDSLQLRILSDYLLCYGSNNCFRGNGRKN